MFVWNLPIHLAYQVWSNSGVINCDRHECCDAVRREYSKAVEEKCHFPDHVGSEGCLRIHFCNGRTSVVVISAVSETRQQLWKSWNEVSDDAATEYRSGAALEVHARNDFRMQYFADQSITSIAHQTTKARQLPVLQLKWLKLLRQVPRHLRYLFHRFRSLSLCQLRCPKPLIHCLLSIAICPPLRSPWLRPID